MSNVVPLQEDDDFLDQIESIEESSPFLKCLIYGDPGVGKTVFAAHSPEPLFIDVEKGTLSLKNHAELSAVKRFPAKNYDVVEQLFWRLREGARPELETIVIDSLTELQRIHMDGLLRKAHERDHNRNPYLPFQQDYKENTEVLRRLVVAFRDIDRHLVLIAHATEQTDESTGRIYWRPALTPKLESTIYGIMDVIGYMTLDIDGDGNETRSLQIRPSRRVKAKSRLNLPAVLLDPNITDLFNAKSNQQTETEEN